MMVLQPQHTIKKFSLELQTQSSGQAHALQQRFAKMLNGDMLREIDELLTASFPPEEIIRINKIEIDLGNVSSAALEKEFAAKCMAALESRFKKISIQQKDNSETAITVVGKEEEVLEQFFYFLSSGKAPWQLLSTGFEQWQDDIVTTIQKRSLDFKERFYSFVLQYPGAIERLLLQFDEAFIQLLVELYHPAAKKEYEELLAVIKHNFPATVYQKVKRKVLAKLLPSVIGTAKKIDSEYIQDILDETMEDQPAGERIVFVLLKAIHDFAAKAAIADETMLSEHIAVKETAENNFTTTEKKQDAEVVMEAAADQAIYIDNAGIVILHPFLQHFFTAVGIMDEDDLKDENSQQKAAHLLQYLVNKEQQAPEYVMALHKILCGMNDEAHIDRFIQLDDIEMKEADELLAAVIGHWTALKNASAESLQETFFQRKGKLTFDETGAYWKLQVERKAVDILLDMLPWGISYIKLPWMQYALMVEW